jgi:hypothetical protein
LLNRLRAKKGSALTRQNAFYLKKGRHFDFKQRRSVPHRKSDVQAMQSKAWFCFAERMPLCGILDCYAIEN